MKLSARNLAILFAIPTLAFAGCGSKSSSTTAINDGTTTTAAPATNQAAPSIPDCDIAPASVIESELGLSVGEPQRKLNDGGSVICNYAAGDIAGAVSIQYTANATAKTLADEKQNDSDTGFLVKDLTGLATTAFQSTGVDSSGRTVISTGAQKDGLMIIVTAHAAADAEQSFVAQLFNKAQKA